jgi:hypothetical protein
MCATCGCGQKDKRHPGYGKGPAGKKVYNMSKAMRNFDAIADALLTDDFEDVEKGSGMDYQRARADMYSGLATGNKSKVMDAAKRRKAASDENKRKLGQAAGVGLAGYGTFRALDGTAIIASPKYRNQRAKRVMDLSKLPAGREGAAIKRIGMKAAGGVGGVLGAGIAAAGVGLAAKNKNKGKYKSQDNQD